MEDGFNTCKKKLIEESGLSDEQEPGRSLQDNNGLDQLDDTLFFENVVYSEADWLEAERAYAAHFIKMQIDNQFDKTRVSINLQREDCKFKKFKAFCGDGKG